MYCGYFLTVPYFITSASKSEAPRLERSPRFCECFAPAYGENEWFQHFQIILSLILISHNCLTKIQAAIVNKRLSAFIEIFLP